MDLRQSLFGKMGSVQQTTAFHPDRTTRKEIPFEYRYSSESFSGIQSLMGSDSKQKELDRLQGVIQQYELKLQYQSQLEQNNKKLNEDLDNLDSKYGNLLEELKQTLADSDKWRQKASTVEQQQREQDILKQHLNKANVENDILKQELLIMNQTMQEKDMLLQNCYQENQLLIVEHQNQEKQIKELEISLAQNDKSKGIELVELSNLHQLELNKINYQQKQEINDLKGQLTASSQRINETNLRNEDLNDKLSKLQQMLDEKEQQIRFIKKEYDQISKKFNHTVEDHEYTLKKLKQQMEDQIIQLSDDREEEKTLSLRANQSNLETINKQLKQIEELKSIVSKLEREKIDYVNKVERLEQNLHEQEIKFTETQFKHQQNQNLQQKLNEQEVSRLKQQLQQTQEQFSKELDIFNWKLNEKEKQLKEKDNQIKQIQQSVEKEKQLSETQQTEIQSLQNQIEDITKQREQDTKIKDQIYEEKLNHMKGQYELQMNDTLGKAYRIQQMLEYKDRQIEDLSIGRDEIGLKLQDVQKLTAHLKYENEQLKMTMANLQHQKTIDDDTREEQKRREQHQIRQYYETIMEQLGYELQGVQALLDQKTRECEEWRTSFIRQRK